MHELFARLMLSGGDIKLPAVPRASDQTALQSSLSERPTLVGANAIQCVEISGNVEYRDDFSRDHTLSPLAGQAG